MADTATPIQTTARWPVVLAVVLTAVLEVLDSTIVNVALPHMKAAFGITSDQTVWILTSYIVASVVVMPLTGLFSKRFGRRRLITTAIVGFMTFSALCGLSQSVGMIVACRLGQGLFGAFLIPLSQSILFDAFPREKRGQAMALFGLGVVVAPVLGPTLGAYLVEIFSWRAVFYVNLPVAAFALMMITGELKADDTQKVDVDWVGLALMVTAIGALQLMLDDGQTKDWFASPFIKAAAFLSVSAFAFFFLRGWGRKDNIIDFGLLRDRSFAAANIAMLGFGLSMFGAIAVLPLFVQGLLGYPVIESGILFMPRGLAAGASMVLTGSLLVKYVDLRLLVAVGLTLTGLGNIWLADLNLNADFWQLSYPGMVSGVGMGLFFVPMSTLAFQNIGSDRQDEASGIYGVMRSLGSSIGIAVVGWQVAARTQFHWATLSAGLTPYDPQVQATMSALGYKADSAQGIANLTSTVAQQASLLAFQDAFRLAGYGALAMLPLVLMLQRPPAGTKTVPAH